jgi:hypothetical protein
MAIYIGLAIVDPSVAAKLSTKHNVTVDHVREALQWPARVRTAFEDHPEHGPRWVALAEISGNAFFAVLLPAQPWEGGRCDTWVVKTARWVG